MPEEKPAASFETGLQQLELIVKEMESADLPLERALELFEKGMQLSETCRKQLEEADAIGRRTVLDLVEEESSEAKGM